MEATTLPELSTLPSPPDEPRRLAALHSYNVLDTPPEEALDDLVRLTAQICGTPMAIITLVDEHRQWFKAKVGHPLTETPLKDSFCALTLHDPGVVVVPDLRRDARFAESHLVTGAPGLRFYASAPLITPEGEPLGKLCVIDLVTRKLTALQEQTLRVLSRHVMTHLELRRQALELARRERLLATMIEAEPDWVSLLAPDGTVRLLNSAGHRVLEADTREQLVGRSLVSMVVQEHRVAFQNLLDRVFQGENGQLEFRLVGLNGTERWMEMHAVSLRGERGEITDFLGIARDVTERKRTQDALRKSEARLRRLIDSNAQGMYFWNTRGAVLSGNDAFLNIIGATRDELEEGALNWKDFTAAEFAAADRQILQELAEKGVCAPFEKEYIQKDGSRVPVLLAAAMFEDNPQEGVCFVFDLTERRKLEQQFLRSQRMESVGTLAGGIAHDLNNALGPILLTLDILKARFLDQDSQELLEIMNTCAQRSADMVRQVLSFARGVEGERQLLQPVDLAKEIVQIARETFPKNIRISHKSADRVWNVEGDPTQLHQVLLNLCVNARDALPDGGDITISSENVSLDAHSAGMLPEARAGNYVLLQMVDNGAGIPRKVIDRIFDPFFTTKDLGKGTGLGLSTVLAIVKSHGGFVTVKSEIGRGATFGIYLPAVDGSAEDQLPAEAPAEKAGGRGEMILVVDDETSLLLLTKAVLEKHGYRVLTAAGGAEAIEIFAREKDDIQLVMVDVAMPVLDGPMVVRTLRKIQPGIRVIAASGHAGERQLAELKSLGVAPILAKPFLTEKLIESVRQALAV